MVDDAIVLEQSMEKQYTVYRYKLQTPAFLKPREAVVLSKIKRDFPYPGMLAIHNSSV